MAASIPEDDLQCPICLDIPQEAVESSCCHHIYCETCVSTIRECPTCRNTPLRVQPSIVLRRLIGHIPIECEFCGAKVERASRNEHLALCDKRLLICVAANCEFRSADREAFANHIASVHREHLIRNFARLFREDTAATATCSTAAEEATRLRVVVQQEAAHLLPPPLAASAEGASQVQLGAAISQANVPPVTTWAPSFPAEFQVGGQRRMYFSHNSRGDRVLLGPNEKYYCGKHVLQCRCCDGNCGPTNGCNCADCMQLDVFSRHLPPGQLVNSEGRVSQRSSNGQFYCGIISFVNIVAGFPPSPMLCASEGPNSGQCNSCKALDGPRYASVRSDNELRGAGGPDGTNVATGQKQSYPSLVFPGAYQFPGAHFVSFPPSGFPGPLPPAYQPPSQAANAPGTPPIFPSGPLFQPPAPPPAGPHGPLFGIDPSPPPPPAGPGSMFGTPPPPPGTQPSLFGPGTQPPPPAGPPSLFGGSLRFRGRGGRGAPGHHPRGSTNECRPS